VYLPFVVVLADRTLAGYFLSFSLADTAFSLADSAFSLADSAFSLADSAISLADSAFSLADSAFSSTGQSYVYAISIASIRFDGEIRLAGMFVRATL